MSDIGTELLENIREDFYNKCKADNFIQKILKEVDNDTATLEDISLLSRQLGFRLSSSLSVYVKPENLPDGRLYYNIANTILSETLKDNYEIINSAVAEVQRAIDKKANINIKPQQAAFPTERVNALVNSVSAENITQEVSKRRLDSPVRNITESFYNDYVEANVKFRSKAGLKCYIIRDSHNGCCKWCTNLAGKYEYPDNVPKDIYRRHDNCGCDVTFVSVKGFQDVWSKKQWKPSGEELERMKNINTPLTKRTRVEAEKFKKQLSEKYATKSQLDKLEGSGIIKADIKIGKSVGAAGKNYPIKLPSGNHAKIVEGTEVTGIKTFAGKGTNTPIRVAKQLEEKYNIEADKWEKVRGTATIRANGHNRKAEIHWYEADGERVEMKVKRYLDDES